MKLRDIPVPDIYEQSADFRFFLDWFSLCLSKIQTDTENLIDLYDPLRCPKDLLWLLSDTMGYKFDDRLCPAFNRLVLLYFMSMIYNRGSETGVTLAAEVNLAQFSIDEYGKENEILYDRLEDTSIPVNSVYVTSHPREGYIDVVYASSKQPVNACLEYVRPLGMYVFEHPGVKFDAKTKISVDARLANTNDYNVSIGPTHVGHYSRADYASMQKMRSEKNRVVDNSHKRRLVWYRNSVSEGEKDPYINPGYRTLYSLQLSNNEHIVDALIQNPETGEGISEMINKPIFGVGYAPVDIESVEHNDEYLTEAYRNTEKFRQTVDYTNAYNLQYSKQAELESTNGDVVTSENESDYTTTPKVNDVMTSLGDALDSGINYNDENEETE